MNCFRELPNKFTSEDCPTYYIEGLSSIKTNILVGKEMIFIHGLGMCEGVGEDSRHGIWASRHSSRIMHLLECVWLSLHVYLGGE